MHIGEKAGSGVGVRVWDDGGSVHGRVSTGEVYGQGRYYWNDGEYYEGEFKDAKMDAHATIYYNGGDTKDRNLKP